MRASSIHKLIKEEEEEEEGAVSSDLRPASFLPRTNFATPSPSMSGENRVSYTESEQRKEGKGEGGGITDGRTDGRTDGETERARKKRAALEPNAAMVPGLVLFKAWQIS